MIEDKVSEILHNFYESYPYMTHYKLAEILDKLSTLKEEVYLRTKETLTKHNLPLITVREDLIEKKELSVSQISEINEVLLDRDYLKEVVYHIQKLLGMIYTSHRLTEATIEKNVNDNH